MGGQWHSVSLRFKPFIFGLFASRVRLSEGDRTNMRNHRQANENRLETGLARDGKPLPKRYIKQGSYAMHTMVRHPENDYDIDDGVLFAEGKLVHDQRGFPSLPDLLPWH